MASLLLSNPNINACKSNLENIGGGAVEIMETVIPIPNSTSTGLLVENGAYLTWEDLWVTVPNRKNTTKPILQGLTGLARPGELLAIMGPSGCGKSTLLDALGGQYI